MLGNDCSAGWGERELTHTPTRVKLATASKALTSSQAKEGLKAVPLGRPRADSPGGLHSAAHRLSNRLRARRK